MMAPRSPPADATPYTPPQVTQEERVEPPLTRLREFLSHPSWVVGVALPGALWSALVEHASEPFLWTWCLAFGTFVIDWFLGSWRAHGEDRFSTTGALGAGRKFILYTCLALLAFLVGAAGEAMFGGVSSSAGFALMTTVNVYIVA